MEGEVSRRLAPEELFKELEMVEKAITSAEGEAGGSKEDLELEHGKVSGHARLQHLKGLSQSVIQVLCLCYGDARWNWPDVRQCVCWQTDSDTQLVAGACRNDVFG